MSSKKNRPSGKKNTPHTEATPTPHAEESPKPNTGESPKPDAEESPKPDAGATPKPHAEESPKPNTEESPKPDAEEPPKPNTEEPPKPDAGATPKPYAEVSTEPDAEEPPKPYAEEPPKPYAEEPPKPYAEATPAPHIGGNTLDPHTEALPEPHTTEATPNVLACRQQGLSLVWLLPLTALLIGAWIAYKTFTEKGPDITIRFQAADGLVAGKTRIKYKAVEMGRVESIQLNDDLSGVVISARMTRMAEAHLLTSTKFWVVRPRLSLRGVSGLDTLVAGAHIEMEPGQGPPSRSFVGLETPQVVRMDAPGEKYVLQTETLGSLDAGSPLYYRNIPVGEVLGYTLAKNGENVDVHIFVRNPFHRLVNANTRFWKISGIDFSVGAEGIRIKTDSMQTLWMGGIAFDTPETLKKTTRTDRDYHFWLYESKEAIAEQAYTKKLLFVLYFEESVRGLSVGAPVEFRGIKVGMVTEIRMEYDPKNATFRIPVLVQVEPERFHDIKQKASDTEGASYAMLKALVKRGLRAQLQTGSYLTGQRFVELDFHLGAPLHLSGLQGKFPELPTMPGSMGEITTAITRLLKTLQAMPLDEMATELHGTLQGANKTVNAPELLASIRAIQHAAATLDGTLVSFDGSVASLGHRIDEVSASAIQTLTQTEQTLSSVEGVINPNAPIHYNLLEATRELAATARALRALIELLETRPESLFFGKETQR